MAINKAMRLALKALSFTDFDVRKTYRAERLLMGLKAPKFTRSLYRLWDRSIICDGREVPVRIFSPAPFSTRRSTTSRGILLFFHGGGWVTESVDSYHFVCRDMARYTGYTVVSVDYRLAPENKFPCGLEDCYAVAKAVFQDRTGSILDNSGLPPDDIVLIGDSAGGNLTAAVSLLSKVRKEFEVSKQILIYPALTNDYTESCPYPSVRENGTGYFLTAKHMEEYMELYVRTPDDLENPYVAPMLADRLTGQPATLILTAELDLLRDEGAAYAARLREEGCYAEVVQISNALHGFFALNQERDLIRECYKHINIFLQKEFSDAPSEIQPENKEMGL